MSPPPIAGVTFPLGLNYRHFNCHELKNKLKVGLGKLLSRMPSVLYEARESETGRMSHEDEEWGPSSKSNNNDSFFSDHLNTSAFSEEDADSPLVSPICEKQLYFL